MPLLRAGAMGRAQLLCDKHRNQRLHDCARANAMLRGLPVSPAAPPCRDALGRAGDRRRVLPTPVPLLDVAPRPRALKLATAGESPTCEDAREPRGGVVALFATLPSGSEAR